jgi:hypothetical protein
MICPAKRICGARHRLQAALLMLSEANFLSPALRGGPRLTHYISRIALTGQSTISWYNYAFEKRAFSRCSSPAERFCVSLTLLAGL